MLKSHMMHAIFQNTKRLCRPNHKQNIRNIKKVWKTAQQFQGCKSQNAVLQRGSVYKFIDDERSVHETDYSSRPAMRDTQKLQSSDPHCVTFKNGITVSLIDPMHLLCLGVMRWLLACWVRGTLQDVGEAVFTRPRQI
jgi:hypothetical protein